VDWHTCVGHVDPGTEFVLDAGDGVAYLQNEASWEFRNGGADQGAGLGGGIFSTAAADNPGTETEIGLELTELASTELDSWNAGDAESATFAYWRATLAPGESIPAPADGVVQLVAPEPQTDPELTLTTSAEGAVRNDGTAPIAVFGLTFGP
jgi:hypothetical protein